MEDDVHYDIQPRNADVSMFRRLSELKVMLLGMAVFHLRSFFTVIQLFLTVSF